MFPAASFLLIDLSGCLIDSLDAAFAPPPPTPAVRMMKPPLPSVPVVFDFVVFDSITRFVFPCELSPSPLLCPLFVFSPDRLFSSLVSRFLPDRAQHVLDQTISLFFWSRRDCLYLPLQGPFLMIASLRRRPASRVRIV